MPVLFSIISMKPNNYNYSFETEDVMVGSNYDSL